MRDINTEMRFDSDDIEQNKVMAILAYIIFLIPLLVSKDSPYARYHTNQGLVLFITAFVAGIVLNIFDYILGFIIIIGWIVAVFLHILYPILILALVIIGIINAANGKAKPLPFIGHISIIK
jgi:uncharacterized membrane protein